MNTLLMGFPRHVTGGVSNQKVWERYFPVRRVPGICPRLSSVWTELAYRWAPTAEPDHFHIPDQGVWVSHRYLQTMNQVGKSAAQKHGSPVSLVVPVFNEKQRLQRNGPALAEFIDAQPADSRLIIVDDGSDDDTLSVARSVSLMSQRVEVLACPHLGKGAAVESGISNASTPLIGYTDVDLATPLHEIQRLLDIASGSRGLVIGSRGMPDSMILSHQHPRRELLGRAFNLLVQSTLAPGVMDTQCGAKFARTEVWAAILENTHEIGFAWDAEAVAVAIRKGLGVHEIGIEWSHDPMTRVHVWRDGIGMVNAVLRIALRQRGETVLNAPASVRTPG